MEKEDSFYREIGARIRKSRKVRGLTQDNLARAVRLTRTSITNIEKGRQKLLAHTLCEFAYVLRVELTELLPKLELDSDAQLEEALRDKPSNERDWVKATVTSALKGGKV